MASTKPAAAPRRSSSGRDSKRKDEPDVSPARWAGVAFVITAIVAAIMLGVVSPSDPAGAPGAVAAEALITPAPTELDTRKPIVVPSIINPEEGMTKEVRIPVTVELPKDELPRKTLKLLILRGDDIAGQLDEPKTGDTAVVHDVQLVEGPNELAAVLSGPGGFGPRSAPVLVTVDRDALDLTIIAPEDKHKTFEENILVEGTSEVRSEVLVRNEANGWKTLETVGSTGEFSVLVPLKRGVVNPIEVTSEDDAKVPKTARVKVTRLDGKPKVKVKAIDPIKRSALPKKIKVQVVVTDAKGQPMKNAEVFFSLGGPNRTAETATISTNANGRANWTTSVSGSSSLADALELVVKATSALSEDSRTVRQTIEFD